MALQDMGRRAGDGQHAGAMSQIFTFSVRNDSVAKAINDAMAKGRLELQYEEHRGVPTTCFGETNYYVTGVKSIGN
jgi:hypothetical protein